MSTTLVSNIAVFSDATGHGNQSHLVYAVNQQRWWLFYIDSKTATTVKTMVSSSNDLTTATWSAGTSSPALGTALKSTDQRNLGVLGRTNGSTDAVHVDVSTGSGGGVNATLNHIRATFTGATSISWDASWNTVTFGHNTTTKPICGNTLGISSSGVLHRGTSCFATGGTSGGIGGDPNAAPSTNADTTSTWTNGWSALTDVDDSMANSCGAFALADIGSAKMLIVFENASVSDTTGGGLRYNTYSGSGAWPTNTGNADVGIGTSTQDQNDWALCAVNTTHIFAVRRDSSNTYLMRMFNGSTWAAKTAPPNQNHLAGSGVFLATDGTNMWMFVLDSASNQPVKYAKYTVGTDTWDAAWTQLEAAGSSARNYISGSPVVGNSQIGVIYTAVNGSNFDIVLSALSVSGGSAVSRTASDSLTFSESATRLFTGVRTTSDHGTFSESIGRLFVGNRAVIDSETFATSVSSPATHPRTTADSLTFADATTRSFVGARTASDHGTFSDVATNAKSVVRSGTDSLTFADAATRTLVGLRTVTDLATFSDTATASKGPVRSASDVTTFFDSATRQSVDSRTTADSVTFTDTATRQLTSNRTAIETQTFTEVISRQIAAARTSVDLQTFADTATGLVTTIRTAADTIGYTDSATRAFVGVRLATDAVQFSEVATAITSGQDNRGRSRNAHYEQRTFDQLFSRRRS